MKLRENEEEETRDEYMLEIYQVFDGRLRKVNSVLVGTI